MRRCGKLRALSHVIQSGAMDLPAAVVLPDLGFVRHNGGSAVPNAVITNNNQITRQFDLLKFAKDLIDLEIHAATTRSRARSDEYAKAASNVDFFNAGYSARISLIDMSAAKQSSATATMILVPLKHGLPWQTVGSDVMWSRQFIGNLRFFAPLTQRKHRCGPGTWVTN